MTFFYANGTKVEKINSEPGDMHQDGARGTVISHLGPKPPGSSGILHDHCEYGYFVRWQDFRAPVFICECRLHELI